MQAKYKKEKLQFMRNLDDAVLLICSVAVLSALYYFGVSV